MLARLLCAAIVTLAGTAALAPAPAAGFGVTTTGSSAPAADPEGSLPLHVSLTTLTPAAIPRRGAITLAGHIVNSSDAAFEDVNVMPFVSATPITSRDGLAQAAATDPSTVVGNRLTDPGTYATVDDLAPGARTSFRLRVPVESLGITGDPGVYWVGVHAIGADSSGRRLIGLTRSFIPLVPPSVAKSRSTPVSFVLPVRERVRRTPDGRLARPEQWAALTSRNGRLTRLADLAASAGDAPVSWVVDPAVLDAIEDFADGNPPLGLQPKAPDQESPPSESPSEQDDPDAGPVAPADAAGQRARARAALERLTAALRAGDLMSLGYADPDAVSVTRRRPGLLRLATELTQQRLGARQLTATTVFAPFDGFFDPDLLDRLPKQSLVLLSDQGQLDQPVASRLATGQDLVLTDARASAGGPGPTRAHGALALRQRLLAEASLELYSATPRPIVMSVPPRWDPGGRWRSADLFGVLGSTPWVRVASLPRDPSVPFPGTLSYGDTRQARELTSRNLGATHRLVRTGRVVDQLLSDDTDIADRLSGAAFAASSWFARSRPGAAVSQVLAINAAVRGRLDRVRIEGTDFVTLSGGSGTLTVALVNGLDQPITVGIEAAPDSAVQVETPAPVQMGPGQRTTLRLAVSSTSGVHEVTLHPVTSAGAPAGQPFTFSMRTSQVSQLIWVIVAAGGVLLAVMIARRIVLRIRHHRWRSEDRAIAADEVAR